MENDLRQGATNNCQTKMWNGTRHIHRPPRSKAGAMVTTKMKHFSKNSIEKVLCTLQDIATLPWKFCKKFYTPHYSCQCQETFRYVSLWNIITILGFNTQTSVRFHTICVLKDDLLYESWDEFCFLYWTLSTSKETPLQQCTAKGIISSVSECIKIVKRPS